MRSTSEPPKESRDLAGNPQWDLVLRVAASPQFAKAARLRDFLFYIAERSLTNRADEITEQQIGIRVFERDAAYNPAEDNIVRVNARYLRNKLKEYFEGIGSNEPESIEIPKGGYVPVFRPRTAEPAVAAAASAAEFRLSKGVWAAAALGAVLLAACIWLFVENRALRSASPARDTDNLVGVFLLGSNGHACMVAADSSLVILQRFGRNVITVERYAERKYISGTAAPDPAYGRLFEYLLTRPYTSFADLNLYSRIVAANPRSIDRLSIRHARSLQSRDFKQGNFLIVGSPRSNPWTSLFDPHLNFRFGYRTDTDRSDIINVNPGPGESAFYVSQAPGEASGEAYALISLTPNLSGNGAVLLIGGTTSEATEAAGEYALGKSAPDELRRRFGVDDLRRIRSFQLLLRTSAIGGTAQGATVVAQRVSLSK